MVHKALVDIDEVEESVNCVCKKQKCNLRGIRSQCFGMRVEKFSY